MVWGRSRPSSLKLVFLSADVTQSTMRKLTDVAQDICDLGGIDIVRMDRPVQSLHRVPPRPLLAGVPVRLLVGWLLLSEDSPEVLEGELVLHQRPDLVLDHGRWDRVISESAGRIQLGEVDEGQNLIVSERPVD